MPGLFANPTSSIGVVAQWANLSALPQGSADLKVLWAGSGDPQASDFNAGAARLAGMLQPLAFPGQQIDQAFILGLNPSTVDQLGNTLGF